MATGHELAILALVLLIAGAGGSVSVWQSTGNATLLGAAFSFWFVVCGLALGAWARRVRPDRRLRAAAAKGLVLVFFALNLV